MRYYELTDKFILKADLASCWDHISKPENLPRITPKWLQFTIKTEQRPVPVGPDMLIDYTIRWMGIPVPWRSRIVDWIPQRQLSYIQVIGPYTTWLHQHFFEETSDGTMVTDRVYYLLPFGPLGAMVHSMTVKHQLRAIFRHRRKVLSEDLGWVRAIQDEPEIRPAWES